MVFCPLQQKTYITKAKPCIHTDDWYKTHNAQQKQCLGTFPFPEAPWLNLQLFGGFMFFIDRKQEGNDTQ